MIQTAHIVLLVQLMLAGPGGAEDYVRIQRLSERVLLAYWLGTGRCNLTVIQSDKGLVVVDTEMSPGIMAPIKRRVEQELGRSDWTYVINTHAHMHHTGGNCLFPDATVVGHDNLSQDMAWLVRKQADPAKKQQELERARLTLRNLEAALPHVGPNRQQGRIIQGEIEFWKRYISDVEVGYAVVPPSLTFADRHTLDLGDLRLELVFFGRGHSLSDTLVYVPQERLLVTGAIVYQRRHLPEIGEASDLQDVYRFLAILNEFLAQDRPIEHVVPSHSRPLQKRDLRPVRDYYEKMLKGVHAAQQKGLTLAQTMEQFSLRQKFRTFNEPPPGHWAHGVHERNLRNLWRILQEEESTLQRQ